MSSFDTNPLVTLYEYAHCRQINGLPFTVSDHPMPPLFHYPTLGLLAFGRLLIKSQLRMQADFVHHFGTPFDAAMQTAHAHRAVCIVNGNRFYFWAYTASGHLARYAETVDPIHIHRLRTVQRQCRRWATRRRQARHLAVAMAWHGRLGEGSALGTLADCQRLIMNYC